MADGRINKCKECTKIDVSKRLNYKMKDPLFREQERARSRGKYYRLDYKDKYKPTPEKKKETMEKYWKKYPEKAKAKNKTRNLKKNDKKKEFHHWSYNNEHLKDIIELSKKDHKYVHRYLKYDQQRKMYRNNYGLILNTKEKHIMFIESLLLKEVS